jgi:HEAT repeat protein
MNRSGLILSLLLLTICGCKTFTAEQKAIEARLDNWSDAVDDAEDSPEDYALAMAWAKNIKKEPSAAVRSAIIQGLSKLIRSNKNEIKGLILETLKNDPHEIVRLECVEGLANFNSDDVLIALSEVLTRRHPTGLLVETSPEVRAISARQLGALGSKNGAIALLIGLKDPVDWVRYQAENSLSRLKKDQQGRSFEEWKRWIEEIAKEKQLEEEQNKKKKESP